MCPATVPLSAARPDAESDPRVLVVDDEPDGRDLLRALLEMDGYRVECAGNGLEALELLDRNPRAAVVVLDLAMPALDGFGVRSAMLLDPRLAGIPVIVLSALRPRGASVERLKPAALMPKPLDPGALLSRVAALCRGGSAPSSAALPT
ncbi:MAG TPA: response regulator [Gemmatimonadota bacterium]